MFAYCGNNPVCNSDATGMLHIREGTGGSPGYVGSPGESGGKPVSRFSVVWPTNWPNMSTAVAFATSAAILTFGVEALRQEQFSIRRMNRPKTVSEELSDIARSHRLFECMEAAASMAAYLRSKGKNAEIITIMYLNGYDIIWCISKDLKVSENGVHVGLLYDGTVYCNIHPYGLPETSWVNDFDGTGEKIVTKTPI